MDCSPPASFVHGIFQQKHVYICICVCVCVCVCVYSNNLAVTFRINIETNIAYFQIKLALVVTLLVSISNNHLATYVNMLIYTISNTKCIFHLTHATSLKDKCCYPY